MKKNLFPLFVAVALVLAACAPGVTPPPDVEAGTPTASSAGPDLAATVNAQNTQIAKLVNGQSAAPVAAQPAGPTDAFLGLSDSTTVAYDIKDNHDVGDGTKISLIYALDGFGSCFVGIVDVGKSLDFESASITGKFLQTTSPLQDVVAAGNKLADNTKCASKLYVGDAATPSGWTKEFVAGWKMSTWAYTEKPIDTGSAVWTAKSIALTDTPTWTADGYPIYCQLWDGTDASHLYHFFLESGKTITTIVTDASGKEISRLSLQGTCWTISGGSLDTIKARATQMSFTEVANRDAAGSIKPTIDAMYVGTEQPMSGFTITLATGWSVVKN